MCRDFQKQNICKNQKFKAVYTAVLAAVFIVPLVFSFDVFAAASAFRWRAVDQNQVIQLASGLRPVTMRSSCGVRMTDGFYSDASKSFALRSNLGLRFYQIVSKVQPHVFDAATKERLAVSIVSEDILNGESLRRKYDLGGGFGFSLSIIWLLSVAIVWMFCTGWTKCSFCQ